MLRLKLSKDTTDKKMNSVQKKQRQQLCYCSLQQNFCTNIKNTIKLTEINYFSYAIFM